MMKLMMQLSSITKSQSMPIRKKLPKEYHLSLKRTGFSAFKSSIGGLSNRWSIMLRSLMYFFGSARTYSMHLMKSLFIIFRVVSVLSMLRPLGMALSREKNLDAAPERA